jgi:hypothetical protein
VLTDALKQPRKDRTIDLFTTANPAGLENLAMMTLSDTYQIHTVQWDSANHLPEF